VTNIFSNRSRESIRARSPRLVPVDLTVDAIVAGLQLAVDMIRDIDLRTDPAHSIPSPASWEQVFDGAFIEELLDKLGPQQPPSPCATDQAVIETGR